MSAELRRSIQLAAVAEETMAIARKADAEARATGAKSTEAILATATFLANLEAAKTALAVVERVTVPVERRVFAEKREVYR
jgi:hypothetical protein